MSDIRKYAVAPTSRLHLKDASDNLMYADGPDGQPDPAKPMAANVYGPGSKEYAKAQSAANNRAVRRLQKRGGKAEQSAEEKAHDTAQFLAGCTESLENIEYDGLTGEALFLAVYTDDEIGFIREQIGVYVGNWENFTKGSSKP